MSYCMKIENIPIYAEKELSQKEANNIYDYVIKNKTEEEDIASINVTKENNEYHLDVHYVQPEKIERLRRITGYLSNLKKFNDGKRCEERDRVKHL